MSILCSEVWLLQVTHVEMPSEGFPSLPHEEDPKINRDEASVWDGFCVTVPNDVMYRFILTE